MEDSNVIKLKEGDIIVDWFLPKEQIDKLEVFSVKCDHPAYPGFGVRAKEFLEKGSNIGFYAGWLRKGSEAPDNAYVFNLREDWVIDAGASGNVTRYINDYRGTGQKVNIDVLETVVKRERASEIPGVIFVAATDIKEGEELLFDYGPEYWAEKEVIDLTGKTDRRFIVQQYAGKALNEKHTVTLFLKSETEFGSIEVPSECSTQSVVIRAMRKLDMQQVVLTSMTNEGLLEELEINDNKRSWNHGEIVYVFTMKQWKVFGPVYRDKTTPSDRRNGAYRLPCSTEQSPSKKTTESIEMLEQRASFFGLHRSCMSQFEAVAEQLRLHTTHIEETAVSVKNKALQWVIEHEENEGLSEWVSLLGDSSTKAYVTRIRMGISNCDDLTLFAIRQVYGVSVVMISSEENDFGWCQTYHPKQSENDTPLLWLGDFKGEYLSLTKRKTEMKEDNIVTFFSQAGGVGKTTLLVNMAVKTSQTKRVAVIDCAPQMTATHFFLRRANISFDSIYEEMVAVHSLRSKENLSDSEEEQIMKYRKTIGVKNIYDILNGINKSTDKDKEELMENLGMKVSDGITLFCSHPMIQDFELKLAKNTQFYFQRLRHFCKFLSNKLKYDAIFIDLGPGVSIFNQMAVSQSSHLVLPCCPSEMQHPLKPTRMLLECWKNRYKWSVKTMSAVVNKFDGTVNGLVVIGDACKTIERVQWSFKTYFDDDVEFLTEREQQMFFQIKEQMAALWKLLCKNMKWNQEEERSDIQDMEVEEIAVELEEDQQHIEEKEVRKRAISPSTPLLLHGSRRSRKQGIVADDGGFLKKEDALIYENYECICKEGFMFDVKRKGKKRVDNSQTLSFLEVLKMFGVHYDAAKGEWEKVTLRRGGEECSLQSAWKEAVTVECLSALSAEETYCHQSNVFNKRERVQNDVENDLDDVFEDEYGNPCSVEDITLRNGEVIKIYKSKKKLNYN